MAAVATERRRVRLPFGPIRSETETNFRKTRETEKDNCRKDAATYGRAEQP